MKEIRKMQIFLVLLSLLFGAFAFYFFLRAEETTAEAEALRAEGARIHAEAAAEKAIKAKGSESPSE